MRKKSCISKQSCFKIGPSLIEKFKMRVWVVNFSLVGWDTVIIKNNPRTTLHGVLHNALATRSSVDSALWTTLPNKWSLKKCRVHILTLKINLWMKLIYLSMIEFLSFIWKPFMIFKYPVYSKNCNLFQWIRCHSCIAKSIGRELNSFVVDDSKIVQFM